LAPSEPLDAEEELDVLGDADVLAVSVAESPPQPETTSSTAAASTRAINLVLAALLMT
jgi:hypothetical protein